MDEDLELVEEVLNGNLDSFNILINKYEFPVLKFVYNTIHDREAAEDITQEVFITVYNKLYTYKKQYKFTSWVFQIARNKCIDFMRKYRRVYESNIEDEKVISSKEDNPEEKAEFNDTKQKLQNFINGLDDIDKDILNLRYSEEITFLEISKILNLTESTVKRRFYKIREDYKKYISRIEERCRV